MKHAVLLSFRRVKGILLFTYVFFVLLYPALTFAQKNKEKSKTLIEVSSGFYMVVKNATLDLDSSLSITSKHFRLSRVPIITEGIDVDYSSKYCHWMDNGNVDSVKKILGRSTGQSDRARLSLLLGAYYVFSSGFRPKYIDSSIYFLNAAKRLCEGLHNTQWSLQCAILLGKCYFKKNDIAAGKKCFEFVTDKSDASQALLAKSWNYQGMYCPFLANTTVYRIECLRKALHIYQQLSDTGNQVNTLMNIAYLSFANQNIKDAENAANASLLLQKEWHFSNYQYTYDLLAYFSALKANIPNQLSFALAAVDCAEANKDSLALGHFYRRVGTAYLILDNKDESSKWLKKALIEFERHGMDPEIYPLLESVALSDPNFQSGPLLINFIETMLKKSPPANVVDQQYAYLALGHGYEFLKKYKIAENYFLKAEELQKFNPLSNGGINNSIVIFSLGRFYVKARNYNKGKSYLLKLLTGPYRTITERVIIMHTYYSLHLIDSVSGNYVSSLKYLNKYADLGDSILSENQNKAFISLNVKYETAQKEKDIQLLKAQNQLDLQRAGTARKVTYSAIIGLIFVIAMIYNRYYFNKKSNRQLKLQRVEIDQQNHSLQLLNHKQTILLTEKELLVREIHHRVKNNLQIVISLLTLQSSYLKNDSAVEALHESQGRIRSIALIHQKLYGNNNVRQIGMNEYIPELINYLTDGLGAAKKNIEINHSIQPVTLDISQAVPIGLIINEAITNSVKYAFENRDKGEIHISMTDTGTGEIDLSIADNGKGLASEIDIDHIKTMGFSLIKGLVDQLDGSCEFTNNNGFVINLKFIRDAFFANNPENFEELVR